jgi:TAT (twin-arginine translocation) pathway signal sequence
MPRNISRRELLQTTGVAAAGAAAVSLVPAVAWTDTAAAAPQLDPAPATEAAAAKPATLFPWIGM